MFSRFRKKYTMGETISSWVGRTNFDDFSEFELHAELCYAECLLQRALLTFIQVKHMSYIPLVRMIKLTNQIGILSSEWVLKHPTMAEFLCVGGRRWNLRNFTMVPYILTSLVVLPKLLINKRAHGRILVGLLLCQRETMSSTVFCLL